MEEFGLNATMEHHWHNPVGRVERGTSVLCRADAFSALYDGERREASDRRDALGGLEMRMNSC
jgi:hypothetical protein